MCGIAGFVGSVGSREALARMLDLMAHRGPDARGIHMGEGFGIGHNRLAIVDRSEAGNQPFVSADGSTVLAVNGEIYNFREIREDLLQRGHRFRSKCDSEVILEGFLEFGESLFERLNGMFAVALWDGPRRRMILARDRMGIKPIYYSVLGNGLLFASELKAIASCPEVPLEPDYQALSEYLCYQHPFEGRTLNRDIRMLQPGGLLWFQEGSANLRRFWEPKFDCQERDDPYEEYRICASRAVERHLLGEVPMGAYLSAGMDSSIVTYFANLSAARPMETFTGSFGMSGYFDESKDASRFAAEMGSPHQTVEILPRHFEENFDSLLWHLDEPRAGMGSFPQFQVASQAARKVRVVLTGHGGDELFAGYPVYRNLFAGSQPLEFLVRSTLREKVLAASFAFYPMLVHEAAYGLPVVSPPGLWGRLLRDDVLESMRGIEPSSALEAIGKRATTPGETLTRIYLEEYLPSLFVVEDKVGMAFSMESRTPLCDNDLVDLGLSIPLARKLKGMELKHVPRHAMRRLLAHTLYSQPQRRFSNPMECSFRRELNAVLRA